MRPTRAGIRSMLAVVTLLAAAACSGDDTASTPTTTAVVSTTAPSTTTGATTTAAPSTSGAPTTTAAATTTPAPRPIEPAPCLGDELSEPERVTCGYFEVPERHENPDGPTIKMRVAVVQAADPGAPADPVLFLNGGPGDGSVQLAEQFLSVPVFGNRNVILVDIRGTATAQPSLECPEMQATALPSLALAPDDPATRKLDLAGVTACHDRLVASGVDLAAYNSVEVAADLADLRVSLGIDEWNVYGLSTGGRLALEYLRRHPEGIRSLVLDASVSPAGNLTGELWPHAQRAFDALFQACQDDGDCRTAFGDLEASYHKVLTDLAANPVATTGTASDDSEVPVLFTPALAISALRNAMYDSTLIPILPLYLDQLAKGESFDEVANLIVARTEPVPGAFSNGLYLSMTCQEEVAFLPTDIFTTQAAQFPDLAPAILASSNFDECAVWDVGTGDPSVDQPVESDIPALLLVGQYDPVHPRESSDLIASTLSHSTVVEFPGLGHGTLGADPCPATVVGPFLNDPTKAVDTTCVDEMVTTGWLLP